MNRSNQLLTSYLLVVLYKKYWLDVNVEVKRKKNSFLSNIFHNLLVISSSFGFHKKVSILFSGSPFVKDDSWYISPLKKFEFKPDHQRRRRSDFHLRLLCKQSKNQNRVHLVFFMLVLLWRTFFSEHLLSPAFQLSLHIGTSTRNIHSSPMGNSKSNSFPIPKLNKSNSPMQNKETQNKNDTASHNQRNKAY